VVVAVHESFVRTAHLWAEDLIELADGRLGRSSLWDVREHDRPGGPAVSQEHNTGAILCY
jgi:hypothetical protein